MAALASDWLRHFRLLLWNGWTEVKETYQEAWSQRPLPSLCFSGRSEKQDGRPGHWLAETFLTSPLKPLNGIQQNLIGSKISKHSTKFLFFGPIGKTRWPPRPLIGRDIFDFSVETAGGIQQILTVSKISTPSTKFVLFGPIGKTRWPPGLWLAEIFSTSSLKPLNGIQRNLTGSKISKPSTKFCVFWADRKTRWPPWPLIGWDIFDFSSETAERNSTKFDRKQDLKSLYQVCVFWADRKNKMAAPTFDWPRHFRLLCRNRWREFNKSWQEARSKPPLPSLCFSGRSEKQDGRPGLWLAETFSTSPLKRLNGSQRNLSGSMISTPSTKFVFFGPIGKTRWPPWPLIGWDIFDFSSETPERNSTKFDRKQDLKALYQVSVFRANRKNKMAAPASDWPRHFRLLCRNRWRNSTNLDSKQDLNALYQVCAFRTDRENKMAAWPLIGRDIFDFFSETAEWNSTKLDRNQDLNALYQVCVFRADRKNKMAALASDWPRHFRLLLWNRWTEFNETW